MPLSAKTRVKSIFLLIVMLSVCADAKFSWAQTSEPEDVSNRIEYVGNPFTEQFPEGDLIYARNIWDMVVFDNKLYFGYGNSDNDGPASNAGPLDMWTYDGESFKSVYKIDDEQIDHFEIIGDALFIPGHDPAHAQENGNLYIFQDGTWTKLSTIPHALHVYDIIQFDNQLVAATSTNSNTTNSIFFSDDDGNTWTGYKLFHQTEFPKEPGLVAFNLFEIDGELMVSAHPLKALRVKDDGSTETVLFGQALYQFNEGEFAPISDDSSVFGNELVATPDHPFRIVRELQFANQLVFIAAQSITHQWKPIGLRSLSFEDNKLKSKSYPLTDNQRPWDTLIYDDKLYVVASDCEVADDSSSCLNAVYATEDLSVWTQLFVFEAPTFVRSFELYNGYFYFGLGSEPNNMNPDTGNILRLLALPYLSDTSS